MLVWRWWAKVYGFTPRQVGELPLAALTWFPLIEEAEAAATEQLQKQEQRAAAKHR